MPPLSTTPSAPTNTMSTSSMAYATAESIRSFTGTSSLVSSFDKRNPVLSGLPSAEHRTHIERWQKIAIRQSQAYGNYFILVLLLTDNFNGKTVYTDIH